MAQIAEIIKYEGGNSTFIWKHPCEDVNTTKATKIQLENIAIVESLLTERNKKTKLLK